MRIFADRFAIGGAEVMDLATGEAVRLSVETHPSKEFARSRLIACDQLAPLRHPLLAPLIDYGHAEGAWFEARAAVPALRGTRAQIRRTALHVVRFMRAAGVEPSAATAGESIRPAVDVSSGPWNPIGYRIAIQKSLEPLMAMLQDGGRPGVTRVTVFGPVGCGLRTVRLEIARAARLAGFVPIDARLAHPRVVHDTDRHYCVLDWLPRGEDLPWLLAAAANGGRRHLWFRFARHAERADAIRLRTFTTTELTDMVYEDMELGPHRTEIACAAAASAGLPGRLVDLLARRGHGTSPLRVRETATAYVYEQPSAMETAATADLLLQARAQLERMRLPEAEALCRTLLSADAPPDVRDETKAVLATVLLASGDHSALEVVLDDAFVSRCRQGALIAARLALGTANLTRAAALARLALNRATTDEPGLRAHAHLVLMSVAGSTSDVSAAARHADAARFAARHARQPGLRLLVMASRIDRVPAAERPRRIARLLEMAARVSPLCEHDVRGALQRPTLARTVRQDPVADLERLLALVFEAPTEADAATHVAEFLLRELKACTVSVRGAHGHPIAVAGRPWPDEALVADVVLSGGASIAREEVMPAAGEPIRTGGATIGCLAVRWLPATADHRGAHQLMRVAAAAVAPVVAVLNTPAPETTTATAPDDLLGRGPASDRVRELIRRAAAAPYPVLIQGESGSGKELVARAIHARSMRRGRRFCAVNCAAFTDDLLEAELFGHTRGAFTGAVTERAGLFEEADQGTLFLDEVAELSARAQAKLLRVLQEGELRRVGETAARRIDVRVLAATNRSLEAEVDAGRFRGDLRFRLDVLRIDVPPLRERADEVAWLAARIWGEASNRVGTRATLAPDFLAALARYDWPGNVRELQNVLAAVAVHAPRRGRVHAASLPAHVARLASRSAVTFEAARLEFEQRFVRAALARAGGRRALAARQLGVSRQGFAKMIKRLGIEDLDDLRLKT